MLRKAVWGLVSYLVGSAATAALAAGVGGSETSATVWVPDYYGRYVTVNTLTDPSTIASTKIALSSRSCNPNSVAVENGDLYVVCNSDFGGKDEILVFNATSYAYVKTISGIGTDGNNYFSGSSLVAILFDAHGNLWTSGYNAGTLLRVPKSSLASSRPRVDREVIDSPTTPAGLALDSDKSIWVVGQYDGGIVLNFSDSALNQPGTFLQTNPLNPSPSYCISDSAGGCQQVGGVFDNPEGVAVFQGSVWVSNNGGNAPTSTIVRLDKQAGNQLSASTYGGTLNTPFACPGGMFAAKGPAKVETLWINDEGRNVANSDCGASAADQSAKAGLVMEFLNAGLTAANQAAPKPDQFTNWQKLTTSSPGFGGIFVQLN